MSAQHRPTPRFVCPRCGGEAEEVRVPPRGYRKRRCLACRWETLPFRLPKPRHRRRPRAGATPFPSPASTWSQDAYWRDRDELGGGAA